MEVYSNNKQINTLRRFLTRHGIAFMVGIILCVGILMGWLYWNHHQDDGLNVVSVQYQQVMTALDDNKPETVEAAINFVNENQNSYGAMASLNLAKAFVEKNQLDRAVEQLKNGLKATQDDNLQAILSLRLARLQLQQKQEDEVIQTLDTIKNNEWAAIIADIRGETLESKGDINGAHDAWSKGINANASPMLKEIMQMKMNNLGEAI